MKAIVLIPGTTDVRLVDRQEPVIQAADEVKIRWSHYLSYPL